MIFKIVLLRRFYCMFLRTFFCIKLRLYFWKKNKIVLVRKIKEIQPKLLLKILTQVTINKPEIPSNLWREMTREIFQKLIVLEKFEPLTNSADKWSAEWKEIFQLSNHLSGRNSSIKILSSFWSGYSSVLFDILWINRNRLLDCLFLWKYEESRHID